jgi:hypothetical protein
MKKRGKKGKKGPNSSNPAKNHQAGKGEARPQDCFRCGSKTHFSRQCQAPKHVVDAYKAKRARETHLVQVEAPPVTAVAPVMISEHNAAPEMAQVEVPMEVMHVVPPPVPQLDVVAAAAMIANEEKISEMEISAEVDGFFTEST